MTDAFAHLPERLRALMAMEYPRFSAAEMQRRRIALEGVMRRAGVDHLLVCGFNRSGSGVQWLTGWPVTNEAVVVMTPGRRDALFVQYYNHLTQARRLADAADVRWGGESTIASTIEEIDLRGGGRVGIVGPLGVAGYKALVARFGEVADLSGAYTRLRLIKSPEEIDWLRIGAALSDAGLAALAEGLRPGLSERDLADIVERAYVPWGGVNLIHFFGVTPMAAPNLCVPAQFPSTRRVASGDVVFTEISAAFWDYPGQVLRTFAVGAEPPPLYRDLHATADAALDAIVAVLKHGTTMEAAVAASEVIEAAGFTTCDDLIHGFGGGYFPPILGSRSRPAGKLPDMVFEAGMTVVVQPNVVTTDGTAGVQTGELVLITETGIERMHGAARGFARV
ncbi:MAG: xaa-Pro aminopeptidase [Rhodospirillales bacterium]|nr:xaa-Pro aminopeptidase [Rhodospirillales bacterium]